MTTDPIVDNPNRQPRGWQPRKDDSMSTIRDTVKFLRETADRLDAQLQALAMPKTDEYTSVHEAASELRALLGEAYFTIRCEFHFHAGQGTKASWQIYDGREFYEANTLSDAVNEVKATHASRQADPTVAVGLIDDAMQPF